ncbi:MAG TPA: DUF6116 family protein [Planctomycetaceae bacterium]|nr:DUF6116 family protein [Planctomycetaceae bacterium]
MSDEYFPAQEGLRMLSPTRVLTTWFLNYARELRFPRLLLVTLALFTADFFIPDLIPFADEILLGLVAALLALIRKGRREQVTPNANIPLEARPPARP